MKIVLSLILIISFSATTAKPVYQTSKVTKKYNQHFLNYLKNNEPEKLAIAFHIDSIDRVIGSKRIKERYVTFYTKPKKLSKDICSVTRFYYKHLGEKNWELIKANENYSTFITKTISRKNCPKLVSNNKESTRITTPENYIRASTTIESTTLVKLINSKNVIQKQARWPDLHLKWGARGHKNMKPPLDKLKAISQLNLNKNEYFLTYSCVNGCSCLGDLVFKVENKNNKFFKVTEVEDEHGACI